MNQTTSERETPAALPVTPHGLRTVGRARMHPASIAPYALVLLLVFEVLVFSILLPHTFATAANWQAAMQSIAVNLVVAMALLIPLVTDRFDLSVGSNIALSAFVAASLMSHHGVPLLVALAAALALGGAIGVVNGWFVAHLRVDSLVVTLGSATIIDGITEWQGGGRIVSTGISAKLTNLGTQRILGIPVTFVIALVVACVVWYVLSQTLWGRRLGAIGVSEDASLLVGINIRRLLRQAFIVSGALGSLAGLLLIANQGSADPSVGGINFMLPALAGAFLGASAFTPGKYNVPGTIVGLVFIAVAVGGLALLGAAAWVQPVFNGVAIVLSVSVSTYLHRTARGGIA